MQEYTVLVPLSACYSGYEDRLSTRYSPVRHSTKNRSPFRVRLACVKHAASVRSEPGSNSPVQCLANHFDQTLVRSLKTNFLARSSCSVFKDQAPGSSPSQSPPFYPITKDLSNPCPLPQKLFPRPETLASHPAQAPAAAEPPFYPTPQTLVKRFLVKKTQHHPIPTILLRKSNKTTTRGLTGRRHEPPSRILPPQMKALHLRLEE